jgi:hypothetical protein
MSSHRSNKTSGMLRALGLAALLTPGAALAEAGTVSFVDGQAFRVVGGKGDKVPLEQDQKVEEHDVLITGEKSHLELTLADESLLRLGPVSTAELTVAEFKDQGRKVSAKVTVGHAWAKVSTALGGDSKFEVTTERAVAGVRGTTFRVDAKADKSVVVQVFAGAVAVAGNSLPTLEHAAHTAPAGAGKPKHVQVGAPKQVTAEAWEKLVGAQMQVKVASDGSVTAPEKFALADECKDPWVAWNKQRDGEPCAGAKK